MTVILTESVCCMSQELCRTNGTVLLSLDCFIEGKKYSDRVTNAVAPPKNSYSLPPSTEAYERAFRRYVDAGHRVLCLTISKRISGSYESAVAAAVGFSPDEVSVVDTETVAGGIFLIIKYLREKYGNDASPVVMAAAAEEYKKRITATFSTVNSDRLVESSRISNNVEYRRPILNRRPVFRIEDGAIVQKSSASHGYMEISELIADLNSPEYVVVHYLEKSPYLREIGNAIKQKHPGVKIYTVPITLSLKINLGTSIIGVIGN